MLRTSLKKVTLVFVILLLTPGVDSVLAADLFGPEKYIRTNGKPDIYTAQFTAADGEGVLQILNGDSKGSHRVTSAEVYINDELIMGPEEFKNKNYVMEKSIILTAENTLKVELQSAPGSFLTMNIFQEGTHHPPSISIIEPDGSQDRADESFTIIWTDEDPDSNAVISLYHDTDAAGTDGTEIVSGLREDPDGPDDQYVWNTASLPEGDYYVYAIIDDGSHDPVTDYSDGPVTVVHAAAPVFDPVDDQEVPEEQELTFTVHAEDSNDDALTYSAANLPAGASFDPETRVFSWTPEAGQAGEYHPEFTVTDGSLTDTMTVQITVTANPPAVTLSADPQTINPGQSATLTWASEYADTCRMAPDIGEVPVNGSIDVSPLETTTYTITAAGAGGETSDKSTITVDQSLSTVTGTVTDADTAEPLEGAVVSIEAGGDMHSAETKPDGSYEITGISADGRIEITASCTGYIEKTVLYSVSDAGTLEHNFKLYSQSATATVSGVVTNAKTMQPEAEVSVTLSGTQISDVTDNNGFYELSDVPIGPQCIEFFKENFIQCTTTTEVKQEPFKLDMVWPSVNDMANPAEIDPGATIFLRDAVNGRPLENAQVKVYGTDIESVTGPDGACILTGLPSGEIKLEAMAENHKAVYMSVKVADGGADSLTISMPPLTRGAVSGTVTDSETGEPIRNAQIAPAEKCLLGASSESDGSFTLVGVPSGTYALTATHPEYLSETIDHIMVTDEETSTADFTLTPRPTNGSLEGTIRDSLTGEPIEGAVLTAEDTGATATSDQQGYYLLSGLPAGIVNISITAEGYPEAYRTAGVLADQNAATPTKTNRDFELDPQNPSPACSVSKEIIASEGGSIGLPDGSFSFVFPPEALSGDAILTVRHSQDGPQVLAGDELNMDPALDVNGARALGEKIQLIVEPASAGAEIPSIQGWVLIMGQYAQAVADANNIDESSVLPYYWNDDCWTLLRPKPYELITDTVNNLSLSVMDFSTSVSGNPVTAEISGKSPIMLASLDDWIPDVDWAKTYLFIKGGIDKLLSPSPPTNVDITDKDQLEAVVGANKDNKPNPNALPLMVIKGWDPKSIYKNTGDTNPNTDERYSNLLKDLVDHNCGVYRPVFVSHNSRASMVNIGSDLARQLHGKYLNHPGKIKGLPADPEEEDSGSFPYINTLGYSFGGIVSRSYQAHGQAVRNMNIIGSPNHGTLGIIKYLQITKLIPERYQIPGVIDLLLHFSPGTEDLLAYDDREPCASSKNPRLCMLNKHPDALPGQGMSLIAGTESFWWSDLVLEGENDGIVPVSSVFCYTSRPDDGEASLFPADKIENRSTYGFNHFNFSKEGFRLRDNPKVVNEIFHGLSDWVVSSQKNDPSTPYTDNETRLPDEDNEGYARSRVEIQYNCYGRDIDRVALVIYYQDGLGNWQIADSSDNGAYPDGGLRSQKLKTVATGNSFYQGESTLTASCTFPRVNPDDPETQVLDVKSLIIRLKPGQENVSTEPDAHFSMP